MSNKLTEADTYVESLNEIYTFLNDFCKCVTLFECISSPRFFFLLFTSLSRQCYHQSPSLTSSIKLTHKVKCENIIILQHTNLNYAPSVPSLNSLLKMSCFFHTSQSSLDWYTEFRSSTCLPHSSLAIKHVIDVFCAKVWNPCFHNNICRQTWLMWI